MPGGIPESARKRTAARVLEWAAQIVPEGGTEPEPAMRLALGFHPSAIFLLSDGEFPTGAAEAIVAANPEGARIPVHCIDLSGGACGDDLARIAEASGGRYARP
jgi:hypothetical protein